MSASTHIIQINKTVSFYLPQIPLPRNGDAQPWAEAPQRCGEEGGSWPQWRPTERPLRREGGREPSLAGHAGESHEFSSLHQPSHQKGALHTRGVGVCTWGKAWDESHCMCITSSLNFLHCYSVLLVKISPPSHLLYNGLSNWYKVVLVSWMRDVFTVTKVLEADRFSLFFVVYSSCSVCLSLSVSFRLFKTGSLWLRCWTGFSCGPSSQCLFWELS